MRMYRIRWPYDYHKRAGFIVMASSPSAAQKKVVRYLTEHGRSDIPISLLLDEIQFETMSVIEDGLYEVDGGCC